MRLYVCVLSAKELRRAITSEVFDVVDESTATVIALARISFGIFVRQNTTDSAQDSSTGKVLGGDKLDSVALARALAIDGCCNRWVRLAKRHHRVHTRSFWRQRSLPTDGQMSFCFCLGSVPRKDSDPV